MNSQSQSDNAPLSPPMARAFEIARQAEDDPGALPYGAVVVRDGEIIGEGLNRALALSDPTSHGETEAIRDACQRLGTTDLTGATVYTTAEPCSMCVATMLLAGIDRVIYAASADDSATMMQRLTTAQPVLRRRFSMAELREETGRATGDRTKLPAGQEGQKQVVALFEAFATSRQA